MAVPNFHQYYLYYYVHNTEITKVNPFIKLKAELNLSHWFLMKIVHDTVTSNELNYGPRFAEV